MRRSQTQPPVKQSVTWRIIISMTIVTLSTMPASAGEIFDDFDGDHLNENIWWAKTTGAGNASIEDGQLVLTTTGADEGLDSVFLLYRDPIPPGASIKAEIRMNLHGSRFDGWFGFLRDFPGNSHNNRLINSLKDATMFFVNQGGESVQPRGEDGQQEADVQLPEGEFHTYLLEVTTDEYRLSIDGERVHSGARTDSQYQNRVFYVTPDGFDNTYWATIYTVDWIRLSGPSIPNRPTAVTPMSWGEVKLSQ